VTDPFVDWLPPQAPPTPTRDGPLRGLRLAVKDIVDVAGLPTGAGHPDWLATHPVPQRSAPVVDRITDAGAVIVGKTYTDEFAYSMFGSNAHYGTPVNPAAPGHLPGGSSSGSAVAVAAGLADIGLGTDTAGSVRIPASWCGLYGLRPTHDRASREGIVALAPSFDVPGLLCAGLATLRLAATAMLDGVGVADPAPGLRVPEGTPPVFLVHGGEDIVSPPEHSIFMYLALKRAGVATELHVYANTTHGFGVRASDRPHSTWTKACEAWLRNQGLLR